ncbi:MAG TPA: NAD-dependent epimerase/dehydratase family protein [Anaerolineaceae bacterium]|nr:NAD-dependent epimerase/dehydratase family protein [Anaerolineaceae bacterium]HPN51528.1 NAD-dependent epimerase/dehydratase family protein [Anaerolineaceae bacterium]
MSKKIILTGASGFVGANLARRLLKEGHEVHLLLRPGYAPWRIEDLRQDVIIHEVNLTDQAALEGIIAPLRPEWVFHLAVYGAYSWQGDPYQMIQTNITGTMSLLLACQKTGFEAFVNTGSSSEYGFKDHAPAETEALEPNSYYAASKAAATFFCRHTAQVQKLHVPTLRLYSVYGPFENPGRLMPALVFQALQGRLPPLANPDVARDYVYVDDVCGAYIQAASRTPQDDYGPVYNVGAGQQISLREVVDEVCHLFEIQEAPRWGSMPNRSWDTSIWVANNAHIRAELNWEPRISLREGLSGLAEWFKANPQFAALYAPR